MFTLLFALSTVPVGFMLVHCYLGTPLPSTGTLLTSTETPTSRSASTTSGTLRPEGVTSGNLHPPTKSSDSTPSGNILYPTIISTAISRSGPATVDDKPTQPARQLWDKGSVLVSTPIPNKLVTSQNSTAYGSTSGSGAKMRSSGSPKIRSNRTSPGEREMPSAAEVEELTNEKSFPFAVAFGVAFVLSCAACCVLAYVWNNLRKQVKYQRNELYFVEKSFRQSVSSEDDSMKSTNEIYSLIGKRVHPPKLPIRTPPLTPTAPPMSPTTPSNGQLCFKIPPDDTKHDYLELI